ncbi:hypothetical protein D7X32_30015 [Corallococcus carmarthensis]|uniref:Secreted protein n=2 Tax=Corallococcus carmarthensis TaxID=2316728 RepID=A0A3A8JR36_9BACT|nr:hypothetical protein D7X32_30015 [Corallococcus carmarthensis]
MSCVAVALGVLVPAVAWATGRLEGPCDVVIECNDGSVVACHGEAECTYRDDHLGGGMVSCTDWFQPPVAYSCH